MAHTSSGIVKKLTKKIKDKKGTTIVETLIAFLIVVLMLGMLAQVMVMTADLKYKTDDIRKAEEQSIENYWNWKKTDSGAGGTRKVFTDSKYGVTLPGYLYTIGTSDANLIYDFSAR